MKNKLLVLVFFAVLPSCTLGGDIRKQQTKDAFQELDRWRFNLYSSIKAKYKKRISALTEKEFDQIRAELDHTIANHNQKKYGLPESVAKKVFLPFAVPLVREMALAAAQQDTDLLRNKLSEYLKVVYGNDWRKLVDLREKDQWGLGPKRAIFIRDTGPYPITSIMPSLAMLYFNEKSMKEWELLQERLIKELFDK